MPSDDRLFVDRLSPRIAAALDGQGRRYRKAAEVRAERVSSPRSINTILSNGAVETKNRAEPGDYIVTAETGERWVVKPDTFVKRYSLKPGRKNVYLARGEVVAVPNPFGRPIEILASWGDKQVGATDCMIVDVFYPATGTREGQPYLIAHAEFGKTYRSVKR
ncbi:hypothetical protein Rvan_2819 [Rhodomicrobium vannielii ATCC 17100]|uniref:Uncharacterized protein n=1 Tax=Rhodomicrobium vannielii (strain ATCC 17100 / DSM 162 / LMG 4299 / NCIMB 10020 / ATH 3.1.1) TaxID=648757 RepID=E3I8P9_RHOVT|nr:PGDYG domain-containing protein [Rhodomicrobium vannielii]ADP72028.1 hypothetical protein Rvan_2819 [Rhodomicrobium vannielii ATCC 17100]